MIHTLHDIENEQSLLLHGMQGCNFNCFGCFNKNIHNETEFLIEDEVLSIVKKNGYFFENIILSGGEITLYGLELINFIKNLKEVYSGKIIIYTNGSNPHIIYDLINLVDGFYIDIKYNIFNHIDEFEILGIKFDKKTILESLKYLRNTLGRNILVHCLRNQFLYFVSFSNFLRSTISCR
jgi:pyruvate-formate lyase-activating enzyme